MAPLFSYSLAVSIILAVCCLAYMLSASSGKHFKANRLTLIAIYGISLLVPLLTGNEITPPTIIGTIHNVPEIVIPTTPTGASIIWSRLLIIWSAGTSLVLILTLISIARIIAIISKADIHYVNDRRIYVTNNVRIAPFSIGNIIVINTDDFNEHPNLILSHECGHIHYRHTFDMIVAQIIVILCWYNPAAWRLREELKSVHEYQADNYALSKGNDMRSYQIYLIMKAARSKFPAIANNLNKNKLKKRIAMMQKPMDRYVAYPLRVAASAVGLVIGAWFLQVPQVNASLKKCAETDIPHMTNEKPDTIGEANNHPSDLQYVRVTGVSAVKKTPADISHKNTKSHEIKNNKNKADNPSEEIIYEIDGKTATGKDLAKISPETIESITVDKSGEKSRIIVKLKK